MPSIRNGIDKMPWNRIPSVDSPNSSGSVLYRVTKPIPPLTPAKIEPKILASVKNHHSFTIFELLLS